MQPKTLVTSLLLLFAWSCGGGGGGDGSLSSICEPKIAGGVQCTNSNSPVVLIAVRVRRGVNYCTGTFISLTSVLTANHCLDGWRDWPVITTSTGLSSQVVEALGVPDDYTASRDVAILKVPPHLAQDSGISPVPVAYNTHLDVGQEIQVIGFGLTENQELAPDLLPRAARLEIVSQASGTISARSIDGSACHGDSGGPALAEIEGTTSIVGVVHGGDSGECESSGLTVLVDTSGGCCPLFGMLPPDATYTRGSD